MEILLLWVFIAYGMTSIIVWGSIFEKPREWISKKSEWFGTLVSCTLCTSTWVGFFLSITLGGLTSPLLDVHWVFGIYFDGMFTAGSVWLINTIVEFFEESRIK